MCHNRKRRVYQALRSTISGYDLPATRGFSHCPLATPTHTLCPDDRKSRPTTPKAQRYLGPVCETGQKQGAGLRVTGLAHPQMQPSHRRRSTLDAIPPPASSLWMLHGANRRQQRLLCLVVSHGCSYSYAFACIDASWSVWRGGDAISEN